MDGIAIDPNGGEQVVREARHHRILAELPELEVIELRFGPDFDGGDLHIHSDHVDSFYVLEGEAEFTFRQRRRACRPRDLRRRSGRRSARLSQRGRR